MASASGAISSGPSSPGATIALIAVGLLVLIIGTTFRARQMRRYTRISPWKRFLLWDTSPWSLFGRYVRQSADQEQAEAERQAVFAQTQIALAQQSSNADPAARYGMATLPEHAPAEAFPPPAGTLSTPFPPPRPMPTTATADDVLPKQD